MTRIVLLAAAVLVALSLTGSPARPDRAGNQAEVVVALASPPLAEAPRRRATIEAEQRAFRTELAARLPNARVHWRYRLVVNGFSVTLPGEQIDDLRKLPGVRDVYESAPYAPQLDRSPGQIGAPALWGPTLSTAGQGMKIGILDSGVDPSHPFFDPSGYTMPPGFPKGQLKYTTAKVIVARAFPPPGSQQPSAQVAFDPDDDSHGTHVAGIAAGNPKTKAGLLDRLVSGVAPRAYIGNYKVFVKTDAGLSPNANSPAIVAAIEAAVADGMDVINFSGGEPEIEPSRDIVARALDAAAEAGVVPVISAGNEYGEVGAGSVSSPGTAERAIAVGAVQTGPLEHAYFSSVGPTPISLRLKPDVSAPGVNILSSVPSGGWASFSGTSMAAPHVAGAAALLEQRHPTWTVDEIKSALIQSGTMVNGSRSRELAPQFQGGGMIALPRADQPLVFAEPSSLSFGLLEGGEIAEEKSVALRDAGGGAGVWNASVEYVQQPRGTSLALATQQVGVPGELAFEVRVATPQPGDLSGFLVLRHGTTVRRVPFWGRVAVPRLAQEPALVLSGPGTHTGTTRGRPALVSRYRYPANLAGIDVTTVLAGPETVYRIQIRRRIANFGVVVTRRAPGVRVEPRIVASQDENRLTGLAGLPVARNPYLDDGYYTPVLAAGALSPARGVYSIVFDSATPKGAGRFRFRVWVNDVTPPTLRLRTRSVSRAQPVAVAAFDAGSGVSPHHVFASIDGHGVDAFFKAGIVRVSTRGLAFGTHRLRLQVSDYQETKNTENVARILPNTRILTTTVRVRQP